MKKYLKLSIVSLIIVFVVVSGLSILTGAFDVLKSADWYFFILANLFFIASIVFWLIPWGILLRNSKKLSLKKAILVGFSCVYGALTPIQIGSEALRSIKAKEVFGISYSESVSASFIVKGIKFFLTAITAMFVIWYVLVTTKVSELMFVGLISGFIVVSLASLFFLLPLHKKTGLLISRGFNKLSKYFKKFSVLSKYFYDYSHYVEKLSKKKFLLVFVLAFLSSIFEFVALIFCFFSLGVFIDIVPLLVLFTIISVLERAPFLPRGIGLVEAAGYLVLSVPDFSGLVLSTSQIGGILVLYSVVRLIVPTVLSFSVSLIKVKRE